MSWGIWPAASHPLQAGIGQILDMKALIDEIQPESSHIAESPAIDMVKH